MIRKIFAVALLTLWLPTQALSSQVWQESMEAASAAKEKGDLARVEDHLLKALIEAERFGKDDIRRAHSLLALAMNYKYQGDLKQARPFLERSLEAFNNSQGDTTSYQLMARENLAETLVGLKDYAAAQGHYEKLLDVARSRTGEISQQTGAMLSSLAFCLDAQGEQRKALKTYKKALAVYENFESGEIVEVSEILNNMARVYFLREEYQKAEPLFERAIAIDKKVLGEEHPYVAQDLRRYAEMLKAAGREDDAKAKIEQAEKIEKAAAKKKSDS